VTCGGAERACQHAALENGSSILRWTMVLEDTTVASVAFSSVRRAHTAVHWLAMDVETNNTSTGDYGD
jgi:hypothetical protein